MNAATYYNNRMKLRNIMTEIYVDIIISRIEKHHGNNLNLSSILSPSEMILLASLLK
jgi:hypothetical protein